MFAPAGAAASGPMDPEVFAAFQQLIYDLAGIRLAEGKAPLVAARVAKRMRALGLLDHGAYLAHVLRDDSGGELIFLLDAISTNVTSFYRENAHFDLLRQHLRAARDGGRRQVRLWSAACSTGEEPYTIGLSLLEELGGDADARILATDISTRVLEQAKAGCYPTARMQPVPAAERDRWFTREDRAGERFYRVKPELRRLVSFARLNLSDPPFPMSGPFDVVFCRNVMIYFDAAVRQRLVSEIHRLLRPGGLLFVGHAESLTGLNVRLKVVRPSVYERPA